MDDHTKEYLMAKKLTKDQAASIIKPIIATTDEHPLLAYFTQHPELLIPITSIGLMKLPDTNRYISYTIISKGSEILSIEVAEPDLRAIAEEAGKIAFVENFMSKEF